MERAGERETVPNPKDNGEPEWGIWRTCDLNDKIPQGIFWACSSLPLPTFWHLVLTSPPLLPLSTDKEATHRSLEPWELLLVQPSKGGDGVGRCGYGAGGLNAWYHGVGLSSSTLASQLLS